MKYFLILILILSALACNYSEKKNGETTLKISNIKTAECFKNILQSDSELGNIRNHSSEQSSISKTIDDYTNSINSLDFKNCPDLAQTVMVVAAVKGIQLTMTGLESLRIKETDRIHAMQTELAKLGAVLSAKENFWILKPSNDLPDQIEIDTYDDHRMAMAFTALCNLMNVTIENPSVVNKSYPEYWKEMERFVIVGNES